jgi:hypothetical protein
MDPLSITVALLQLTSTLLQYLNNVKDVPQDRARCAIEASNLYNLLMMLRYRAERISVQRTVVQFPQFSQHTSRPSVPISESTGKELEKLAPSSTTGKLRDSIRWSFGKGDVEELLLRIERLKTIVSIALKMNHL